MMPSFKSLAPVLAFAVVYAAVSLSITNSYYQLVMTLVLVWAVFGLSWNLLSGYTGLISFGHAAFFGIGAYTTALGQIYFDLSTRLGVPWLRERIAALPADQHWRMLAKGAFRQRRPKPRRSLLRAAACSLPTSSRMASICGLSASCMIRARSRIFTAAFLIVVADVFTSSNPSIVFRIGQAAPRDR